MATARWPLLLLLVLLLISLSPQAFAARSVIEVAGAPATVAWVAQLSDLHFSVFHPERAEDFRRLVGPALSLVNPSLVLITGDLTDGKSKDLLTMKQEEAEWIEYQNVMKDVAQKSGLDENIFYDLRGNHDNFGVPEIGGTYDFYNKYSINAGQRRVGNVQSVTLQMQNSGWKHLFVGFDSTMEIGLRGPTNLFGHPTDQLLEEIDTELSQWDGESTALSVTKISFGHFPLSFSASSETDRSLKDVFLKHSLSAYLCGHLHTRFGKNLKRHHQSGHHILTSGKYYQYNIHQGAMSKMGTENCSYRAEATREFWEWEMGDWRKSRTMRILAIDSGLVSFVDIDFKLGSRETIVLPTFPVDSRFMQRLSSPHDYACQKTMRTSTYDTVRALIFSRMEIVSVSLKIYDSRSGKHDMVLESAMQKHEGNRTRGDLYVALWNWRAFADPSPDRYWLQIEAIDISGRSTVSQLRPFSINGLTARVSWKWKEFLVMGCQWASLYHPALWFVLALLFSLLLIPRAFLIFSKKHYIYKNVCSSFSEKSITKNLVNGLLVGLLELSRITWVWSGMLLYLVYLIFFPWLLGHVFTESGKMAYMSYKGWAMKAFKEGKWPYVGVPDVMVVVLPHLCFVVLPTIVVVAAMAAEKAACRTHYLSLSGKKKDDYYEGSKRHSRNSHSALRIWRGRWLRKLLLLGSMVVLWKHWKYCSALVKAYEMNPFLHSPIYCFAVPMLLAYAIYRTAAV